MDAYWPEDAAPFQGVRSIVDQLGICEADVCDLTLQQVQDQHLMLHREKERIAERLAQLMERAHELGAVHRLGVPSLQPRSSAADNFEPGDVEIVFENEPPRRPAAGVPASTATKAAPLSTAPVAKSRPALATLQQAPAQQRVTSLVRVKKTTDASPMAQRMPPCTMPDDDCGSEEEAPRAPFAGRGYTDARPGRPETGAAAGLPERVPQASTYRRIIQFERF